jgi:hypothetical protein
VGKKKLPELSEEERQRLQRIVDAELPPLPSGDVEITHVDVEEAWNDFLETMREMGIDVSILTDHETENKHE